LNKKIKGLAHDSQHLVTVPYARGRPTVYIGSWTPSSFIQYF